MQVRQRPVENRDALGLQRLMADEVEEADEGDNDFYQQAFWAEAAEDEQHALDESMRLAFHQLLTAGFFRVDERTLMFSA